MKQFRSALVSFCAVSLMLCLSGCFVKSYYPFYTDQAVQYNVVKFKTFMLVDESGRPKLDKPGNITSDKIVISHKNGESEQINIKFFTAGKTLFLDAQGFFAKETMMYSAMHTVDAHVLYRVNLGKDSISLTPLNTKWFIDSVKNNRINLPGTIRKSGSIDEILFTASSEEWKSFLEKNGEKPDIFEESLVFVLKSADPVAKKKVDSNLISAIQKCDNDHVTKLLDGNVDPNITDDNRNSALSLALKCSTFSIAKHLLQKGADVNFVDSDGKTPLIKVVEYGSSPEIKNNNMTFLLENGANPNATDGDGNTSLIYLSKEPNYFGQLELIKILISKGANINHRNNVGVSALAQAINKHSSSLNTDCIMYLIDNGADVGLADAQGMTPLMYAIWFSREGVDNRVIEALIAKGADINIANKSGHTAFSFAVEYNLTSKNNSIDLKLFKNPSQASLNRALWAAAMRTALATEEEYKEKLNLFEWLIAKGADIKASDANGWSVLMEAAYNVKPENYRLIDYLLGKGAPVNAVDDKGRNLLHFLFSTTLVDSKKTELAIKFIKAGVDVNHRDNNGNTPLMMSFYNGLLYDAALELIKHGANVNERDSNGETALLKVARLGAYEMSKVMVEHKADVNLRDGKGVSPLMYASKTARYNIVKLLIDNGAIFRDGDNLNVKFQSEASVIIEPDKREAIKAGSKLQVKIKPPNNEDWLGVICDDGQADQKIMVYDQKNDVFTSEVATQTELSKVIHELRFLAVIASGSADNKHNLGDIISYKAKPPREVRYVSFKRSFSSN